MATSYLTDAQKTTLNNEFNNLHTTFARPITIWKTAKQIVLNTNPSNNYLFESAPFNDQTQTILVSGVFQARIRYPSKEAMEQFSTPGGKGQNQPNIEREAGDVRLRVDATGAAYLFDAQRVTFDDEIFKITSSKRPHSLVGAPMFFDFQLTKLN